MLLVLDMVIIRVPTLCSDRDIEVSGERRLAYDGSNGSRHGIIPGTGLTTADCILDILFIEPSSNLLWIGSTHGEHNQGFA